MPLRVEIFVDGQEVDFIERSALPIEFNKEADDILNLIGIKGLDIDQVAKQIVLPGSKRNEQIFNQINRSDTFNNPSLGILSVLIVVDSQVAYQGNGLVSIINNNGKYPKSYGLELLGNNFDVIPELIDLNLCDLDLGNINTSYSSIVNSWTDPNAAVVLPPVVYGSTGLDPRYPDGILGGRPVGRPFDAFRIYELRPHIKIWYILQQLFERFLGYSIDSRIYESDYFRRFTYLFGVGEQWVRTDDISPYILYVQDTNVTRNSNNNGGFFTLRIDNILQDNSPVNSQWTGNTTFTPQKAGWYRISALFESVQTEFSIRVLGVEVDSLNGTVTEVDLGTIPVNETYFSDPIVFFPFNGLTFLKFEVELPANDGGNTYSFTYTSAEVQFQLIDRGIIGAPIKLSSCLHCEKSSDFLLGILHLICGASYIDRVRRTFYFENKFYNPAQKPSQGYAVNNSWYKFEQEDPDNIWETLAEADQESITERPVYPFGDNLVLGYKDSGDPIAEYYNENIKTGPLDYGQSQFDFIAIGRTGKKSQNPYFDEVYNYTQRQLLFTFGIGFNSDVILPSVLPSLPSTQGDERYVLPEPTYESDPKIGFYHGIVEHDFFATWIFNSSLNGFRDRFIPCLYTRFPSYISSLVQPPYRLPNGEFRPTLAYDDVPYPNDPVSQLNLGITKKFYLNTLAILKHARKVEFTQAINYDEFQIEDFRKMRRYEKFRENAQLLIYRYGKFEPLQSRKLTTYGLIYRSPTEEDFNSISGDNQNYFYRREYLGVLFT